MPAVASIPPPRPRCCAATAPTPILPSRRRSSNRVRTFRRRTRRSCASCRARGLAPSVRRAGTAWIVDLKPQAASPDAPIAIEAASRRHAGERRLPRSSGAAQPCASPIPRSARSSSCRSPSSAAASTCRRDFVDFRGAAERCKASCCACAPTISPSMSAATRVEVTRPDGLELSSDRDRLLGRIAPTAPRAVRLRRAGPARASLDYDGAPRRARTRHRDRAAGRAHRAASRARALLFRQFLRRPRRWPCSTRSARDDPPALRPIRRSTR